MKHRSEECAVTGREVLNPRQAPRSTVNGTVLTFCCTICKAYFDRYLVKFAEKRYPATSQPAYATIINVNFKR